MRPLVIDPSPAGRDHLADPAVHGEHRAGQLAAAAWRVVSVSSGRSALYCVRAPEAVEHTIGTRARRLIRQAQISAW
jgi:hypothetical protein